MSNHLCELGADAELLVQPDEYLDNLLADLATQISVLSAQYEQTWRAKTIKRALQQQNRVAVRLLLRDQQQRITDSVIRVMPLPEAIALLNRRVDGTDHANVEAQFYVWDRDGYDLPGSAALRRIS